MEKRLSGKNIKVVKGMPSAVVLSILIHVGLFLLAGMLVVFTVVKKEEQKFEPPKAIDRPKMKLKKPKVKVKKTSKPKPTTRIVTKINRANMPDIQLPEMSSLGDGLGSGVVGGFDMMPDFEEVTLFGGGQTIGNDFEGTFYDFKRDRTGRPISHSPGEYLEASLRFLKSGWKPSKLAHYYQSPKKRYATSFVVPQTLSALVPTMFGEPGIEGVFWATLYKGQLTRQEGITFRFIGWGDGAMAVRVNGETVLSAGWFERFWSDWQSSSADSKKYWLGNGTAVVGDWITLEPGVSLDMKVFMVEGGGEGCFMLAVEEKGVKYESRRTGSGSIFPAFKTAEMSRDMLDVIYRNLVPGEVSLTNGPVFCDYGAVNRNGTNAVGEAGSPEIPLPKPEPTESALRMWTSVGGKTMEAEFVTMIGDKVVLKTPKGKQKKLPFAQLSAQDRNYIELANPPVFKIDFAVKTERVFSVSKTRAEVPIAFDYFAKARLTQTSAGAYTHELSVEVFSVGEEIHGDRYVLLDHQISSFTPNTENQRSHEVSGRSVQLPDFTIESQHQGIKPYGYLILVADSRGKTIQHKESNVWLYENVERLRQLKVGVYMDKSCTRVFPTGPKRTLY